MGMTWKDFDILTQRISSRPLKNMMPHVIRNENPACYDPESTLAKGVFDALDNDLPQDDRKSALEVPFIKETSMVSAQSKWNVRNVCETNGWFWICVGMVIVILTVLSGVPSGISISDDCSQGEGDRRECCVETMK